MYVFGMHSLQSMITKLNDSDTLIYNEERVPHVSLLCRKLFLLLMSIGNSWQLLQGVWSTHGIHQLQKQWLDICAIFVLLMCIIGFVL